jgi:hypothetical protein
MEDRIRYIDHHGTKILFVDASHCSASEMEKLARLVPSYVTTEPYGSVLLLADFTGAAFDRIAIERLKEGAVFDRPHLKRSAWVGVEACLKFSMNTSRVSPGAICPASRHGKKPWTGWSRSRLLFFAVESRLLFRAKHSVFTLASG